MIIEIKFEMFSYKIYCFICKYSEINILVKEKLQLCNFDANDYDTELVANGRTFLVDDVIPVIWLPRFPRKPREIAALAHEAYHALFLLLDWASIPLTKDTQEIVAYGIGHIVNSVLETKKR